jgi:hypothetical protein
MTRESETLFLFGAGASAHSGECFPREPPDGRHLFDELVKRGGVASTINGEIANTFRSNFESGMGLFFVTRVGDTTALLRDMAELFLDFVPGDSNLYVRLFSQMARRSHRYSIATLNYDLLIEHALLRSSQTAVPLMKIHGSCNYFEDYGGGFFCNVRFEMARSITNGFAVQALSPPDSKKRLQYLRENGSTAPVMAVYASGKPVAFGSRAIERVQQNWIDAALKARRIIVMGVGINAEDEHVWTTLARSEADLYYVDPSPDRFLQWARLVGRKNVEVLAPTFAEALPKINALIR